MADSERGLGRPERALDLAKSPEVANLDQAGRIELRIVESGARRDLGQYDAAVVTLQVPELRDRRLRPWSARLFYAYADALVDAERVDEAADWFARAAAADRDGETDAAERYAELEGLDIVDTEEEAEEAAVPEEEATGAEVPSPEDEGDSPIDDQVDVPAEVDENADENAEDQGGVETEEAQEESDAVGPTTIEFKAAPPAGAPEPPSEDDDDPDDALPARDVPEAPVVFLEPQEGDQEADQADQESDRDHDDAPED